MCFFGGGKKSSAPSLPPPAPPPPPAPVPVPEDPNPVETADQRRKRVAGLRQGVLSTVKTYGTTGSGADLQPAAASGSIQYGKSKMGL